MKNNLDMATAAYVKATLQAIDFSGKTLEQTASE
jgi:hypothetical protein